MNLIDMITCVQLARIGLKSVAADDRHSAGDIAKAAASLEACDKHAVDWRTRETESVKHAENDKP